MARIENQSAYPLKANPVSTDFVIGTDSQSSNQTVSFSISALQAAVGATIYTNSNIIPESRTVTHNDSMSFTGVTSLSEFLAQHTNGHVFRVNQNGIFGTSFGLGVSTLNVSAILQADSTTKGFLPPRMSTSQRNAVVSPATGLTIFNTDTGFLESYDGSAWITNSNTNLYNSNGSIEGASRVITGNSSSTLTTNMYNTSSSDWTSKGGSVISHLINSQLFQQGDGAGAILNTQSIAIDGATMSILDEINSKGIEYAANYSANFTARSLVDKAYVDATVGTTTIYNNNGTITDQNRTVTLSDTDNSGDSLNLVANGIASSSSFNLRFNLSRMSASNLAGVSSFEITQVSSVFTDTINSRGIQYAADYSANFTARSLVDKDYVDTVSGATFYSSDGTIAAQSRLIQGTANTTITFSTNDLLSSNWSNRGRLVVAPSGSTFGHQNGDGAGAITAAMTIASSNSAFTVTDSINSKGLVYSQDYSANFTNRSLTDKAYVDTKVATTAGYLVAALPASPNTGDVAHVTDADTPVWRSTVVGGGSDYCLVTYNGSNWICQ
jgi:hypothetical protein